jgi:putative colanic acid biosynthesis UDP-glucose lipid carrier transferase
MITTAKIQSSGKKPAITSEGLVLRRFVDDRKNYFIVKRLFDLVVSFFVTVLILSWLLPIIALLIKLESRGPVFFVQKRVGRGGKTFSCFKFRTMFVNKEANVKQAQVNDSRITRVGKFLRISNLDEFPQFFNVLLGHMSIVGPRPHMHADCTKFSEVVSCYKFRNMVKPGITGLAQVKGFRGPTKDFSSIFRRYQYDAFYVRNANFWLDLRIIRQTAAQTIGVLTKKLSFKDSSTPGGYRRLVANLRSFIG